MKKIVVALLALSVVFMFASCDNSGNPPAPTELETVLDDFKDEIDQWKKDNNGVNCGMWVNPYEI